MATARPSGAATRSTWCAQHRAQELLCRRHAHAKRQQTEAALAKIPTAAYKQAFDRFDTDKSGELEYKELNLMLRKQGAGASQANLKRMAGKQKDTGRGAKVTAKNINSNYVAQRAAVLELQGQVRRLGPVVTDFSPQ